MWKEIASIVYTKKIRDRIVVSFQINIMLILPVNQNNSGIS